MFNWKNIGRKNTRLTNYDYTQNSSYFITINTWDRRHLFGTIKNSVMIKNIYGKIAEQHWLNLPKIRPYVSLDEFVIMPNHLHGIVIIARAMLASPLPASTSPSRRLRAHSLGSIIGGYKSGTSRAIRIAMHNSPLPIWQRNYHERIIRDIHSLFRIREYIRNNPKNWLKKENNG